MIKFALKNIRFLENISKIPILKHFFILKISENFYDINSECVLNKFYTDIYVSNKTSKKTSKKRFYELDFDSLKFIKDQNNSIVHDVAVSSGISSSEFYDLLKENGLNYEFYISDKFAEVFVKKAFITKVYSTEYKLLFAYFGFLFAVDKNVFFPITVFLYKVIKKQKFKQYDYKLLLLHPKILEKIKKQQVHFINYDIFETKTFKKYTFVRVMNILNLGYFNKEQITKGLQNIFYSMTENAILLIGRTNSEGINNASFFKKHNNKLINLKDINDGSEIKDIIKNL